MNVPNTVKESFYNNIVGEMLYVDEKGLKQREYYDEFVRRATHPDPNVRDQDWYDNVINYCWEVVEHRYHITDSDFQMAVRKFDKKPLVERLEIMDKYDLFGADLSDVYKAYEVFKEWFDEMYSRTTDAAY